MEIHAPTDLVHAILFQALSAANSRMKLVRRHVLHWGRTPWVDSACADCPCCLVLGAAGAPAPSFIWAPQIVPPNLHLLQGPFKQILGSAAAVPPPAPPKRDAQHMLFQCAAKGGTQKGVGNFFLFRSPFGNHFVTFLDVFGHFFAYPLLPPPFCGRVTFATPLLYGGYRTSGLDAMGGGFKEVLDPISLH